MTEQAYLDLLIDVVFNGSKRKDRTGVGTRSLFGRQIRFDLADRFPLLTTKRVNFAAIVHELIWFLRGHTNIRYLNDNGVRLWDAWADQDGDLGPIYGAQWRSWPTPSGVAIDQIYEAERLIDLDPNSRRIVVSAWNPADLEAMALPPCHCLFQFYVDNGRLSCQLYQRSGDIFLGVPFNIASYALLTCMMARTHGLEPGEFVHTFGDVHLYENHRAQAIEQINREPRRLPRLVLRGNQKSVLDFGFDDIVLEDYNPHPAIKAPVSV